MSSEKKTEKELELKGLRIALLVEFNFEDAELIYPMYRLREAGAQVDLVGPKVDTVYKGKHGYPIKCTVAQDSVSASDYHGLIIPGGFAPDYWRRSDHLKKFTKDLVDANKPVGAICHGPWLLVSSKVLKGRKATSFIAIKDDLENAGAEYVDASAVVDGSIVTSRTPDDLPDFCRTFIGLLEQRK